jgi:hypothetical protein
VCADIEGESYRLAEDEEKKKKRAARFGAPSSASEVNSSPLTFRTEQRGIVADSLNSFRYRANPSLKKRKRKLIKQTR